MAASSCLAALISDVAAAVLDFSAALAEPDASVALPAAALWLRAAAAAEPAEAEALPAALSSDVAAASLYASALASDCAAAVLLAAASLAAALAVSSSALMRSLAAASSSSVGDAGHTVPHDAAERLVQPGVSDLARGDAGGACRAGDLGKAEVVDQLGAGDGGGRGCAGCRALQHLQAGGSGTGIIAHDDAVDAGRDGSASGMARVSASRLVME